jgi:acetyltransferase-like isoleucine patch superfamily enzyme
MDTVIGPNVTIHPSARINVTERLHIGADSTIGANCVIEGRDVRIGHEFWMDTGAVIGGGSCFDPLSSLTAGHFLHMGRDSFINTARPVILGDEVGLGTRTSLYTHGAYLSGLDGFPVAFAPITIGDRVWLPGATVNPNITIGSNVVVAVGSVITHNLPDGCMAAGVPAQVRLQEMYPRPLLGSTRDAFWITFLRDYPGLTDDIHVSTDCIRHDETRFDLGTRKINGPVTDESEVLRNQLRRYGIRFYSRPDDGQYQSWQ